MPNICHGQWTIVGEPKFSEGWVDYINLDIDQTTGIPYVVYKDQGRGNHIYCQRYASGAWQDVGGGLISDSLAGPALTYCEFKINPVSHEPFVVYTQRFSPSTIDSILVKKFDGTNWVQLGNGLQAQYQAAIVFDLSTGDPYLIERISSDFDSVYADTVDGMEFIFKYNDITNFWDPYAELGLGTEWDHSYAVATASGKIYLSKENVASSDYAYEASTSSSTCNVISYNSFTGSSMDTRNSELEYFETDSTLFATVRRVDPFLPFWYAIEVVKFKDGVWDGCGGDMEDTLNVFNGAVGPSLEYNGFTNEIWLSYLLLDQTTGSDSGIVVQKWNGSGWSQVAPVYTSPGVIWYDHVFDREKLAIDESSGQVYVAFREDYEISVITLNTSGISDFETNSTANIFPNPTTGNFTISAEKDIETVFIYSATGELVLCHSASGRLFSNEILCPGIYFIQLRHTDGTTTFSKLVVVNH